MTKDEWFEFACDCEQQMKICGVFDPAYEFLCKQMHHALSMAIELEKMEQLHGK